MSVVRWNFYKNYIQNFSFENEDSTISGFGELWEKVGTPTLELSSLYKKHNTYSQKIVGDASGEGISQTIDISNATNTIFGLIFYTYIVTGTLLVTVEALDINEDSLGTIFSESYSTNSTITKQEELITASISGETIVYLKITFSQSGSTALTCYLDSVIIYEDEDTEVEVNPTQFSYEKTADCQFVADIEGNVVKIVPLSENKRSHIEGLRPLWMWVTEEQKVIFEDWVGEDLIIIDHSDSIYWVDLLRISINFIERQVPDKFQISMELSEARR